MRIACYFIGFNIEDTVAMTVNHYKQFCEKVIYLDNHSTDGSWNAALRAGAECRTFGIPGVLDDREYTKIKNNVWKGTDYDYVILCDNDEILWHYDLKNVLQRAKNSGSTIFSIQGWNMFSTEMPTENWTEIQTGYEEPKYGKLVIFDPKEIKEIGYIHGCHEAKPVGRLVWASETLSLLHYMGVGGAERMIRRHQLYARRLSEFNRAYTCGIEYTYSPESKRQWFEEQLSKSSPLYEVGEPFYLGALPPSPEID